MDAEKPLNPAGEEHRQVHERAEGAIPHQQVAGAQQRMKHPDFGLFVRVEREAHRLDEQAGEGVEQSQHLGHGKAAPLLASFGLAEGFCEEGVSGAIVLEPSTKYARNPHHNPSGDEQARRIAVDDSINNSASTASGRRMRALQYADALTGVLLRCRSPVIAVLKLRTWRMNQWIVSTGPSCRSRHW